MIIIGKAVIIPFLLTLRDHTSDPIMYDTYGVRIGYRVSVRFEQYLSTLICFASLYTCFLSHTPPTPIHCDTTHNTQHTCMHTQCPAYEFEALRVVTDSWLIFNVRILEL